jgi:hypothetical protein
MFSSQQVKSSPLDTLRMKKAAYVEVGFENTWMF